MKPYRMNGLLPVIILLFVFCINPLSAETTRHYGETPDDYVPYHQFQDPYIRYFQEPNEYHGYGREIPVPEQVESVKIGFLGPIEKTVSVATGGASHEEDLGKKMLQGATLAVQLKNQENGFRNSGIPYELVIRNDNGLWGASGNEIIDLAYREKVWAVLGTIDGANSHIAIRVALKAEIPVMNSGDTDPTYTETSIPWAFRCITDDRQMGYLLADYVFKTLKLKRVAALRANNRYGRIGIDEFRDAATRMGYPFIAELNYKLGDTDFSDQIGKLKSLDPEAVITMGNADESALILNQMRTMGLDSWFIGSDRIVTDAFIQKVDGDLSKIAAAYPYNPDSKDPKYLEFVSKFKKQYHEEPESFAAHAYDGMSMLMEAIEKGGLNRAKIRDQLSEMTTYHGVTGIKRFDPVFNNLSPPFLALGKNRSFQFISKDEALTN